MKQAYRKLWVSSVVFFVVGVICLILENYFYQYVDETGHLRESLFLPIGTFSVLLGLLGVLVAVALKIGAYIKARWQG